MAQPPSEAQAIMDAAAAGGLTPPPTGPAATGAAGVVKGTVDVEAAIARMIRRLWRWRRTGLGMRGDEWIWPPLPEELKVRYPAVSDDTLRGAALLEADREQEFLRRMQQRLRRDIPEALRAEHPQAVLDAVLERERRWMEMHQEAAKARIKGAMRLDAVKTLSPEGGYWRMSPHVKEHTPDCVAMATIGWWPHSVLDRIHPPTHPGCACEVLTHDEAQAEGLMGAAIPDTSNAEVMAADIERLIEEAQDAFWLPDDDDELYLLWEARQLVPEYRALDIEEVRWERRYKAGTIWGGRFMPERGGIAPRVSLGNLLRRLMGVGVRPTPRGGRKAPVTTMPSPPRPAGGRPGRPEVTGMPVPVMRPFAGVSTVQMGPAPRNFEEMGQMLHQVADELAAEHDVDNILGSVEIMHEGMDTEGARLANGDVEIGPEAQAHIDTVIQKAANGERLNDDDAANFWWTYRTAVHEMGHAVNPMSYEAYMADPAQRALEEALAEESAHDLAAQLLTNQGHFDTMRWLARNPDRLEAQGTYMAQRAGLAAFMDEAQIPLEDRRELIRRLKFDEDPAQRIDIMAGLLSEATGEDKDAAAARIHAALTNYDSLNPAPGAPGAKVLAHNYNVDYRRRERPGATVNVGGRYEGVVNDLRVGDDGRYYPEVEVRLDDGSLTWRYPDPDEVTVVKDAPRPKLKGDNVTGNIREGDPIRVKQLDGSYLDGELGKIEDDDALGWKAEMITDKGRVVLRPSSVRDVRRRERRPVEPSVPTPEPEAEAAPEPQKKALKPAPAAAEAVPTPGPPVAEYVAEPPQPLVAVKGAKGFDARHYSDPRRSLITKLRALTAGEDLKLADGSKIHRTAYGDSVVMIRPDGTRKSYATANRASNAEINGIVERHGGDMYSPPLTADQRVAVNAGAMLSPATAERPIYVGDDVRRAADLLAEGKAVRLDQPRTASTLLDELAARVNAAAEAGVDAPSFDLCGVTVKDTNLFCVEHKGVPRIKMPQLKGVPLPDSVAARLPRNESDEVDISEPFRAHLLAKGVGIEHGHEPAANLRASQREMNGGKVGGMLGAVRNPEIDSSGIDEAPIFISRDNYVVDGHHRWAALVGHDVIDNKLGDVDMEVIRIDMPITELLAEANDFAHNHGIPQASVQHFAGQQRGGMASPGKRIPGPPLGRYVPMEEIHSHSVEDIYERAKRADERENTAFRRYMQGEVSYGWALRTRREADEAWSDLRFHPDYDEDKHRQPGTGGGMASPGLATRPPRLGDSIATPAGPALVHDYEGEDVVASSPTGEDVRVPRSDAQVVMRGALFTPEGGMLAPGKPGQREPVVLSGVIARRIEDGDILRDSPTIAAAWKEAETKKSGKGYRMTVKLTPEDRAELADYLRSIHDVEEDIAGGAGDPEDVDRSLLTALRKWRKAEDTRAGELAAEAAGIEPGVSRVRLKDGSTGKVRRVEADGRLVIERDDGGTSWARPEDLTVEGMPSPGFFHGTSSEGEALARERGEIRPLSPREIATQIAWEHDVDPDEVYNDIAFEFSRHREEDRNVYITQDRRVAQSYAEAGSEVISDALEATWRVLNRKRLEGMKPEEVRDERDAFKQEWREKHGVTPRVLALEVPWEAIENSTDYQRYVADFRPSERQPGPMNVREWLDAGAPLNTLMLPGPVPMEWERREGMPSPGLDPVPELLDQVRALEGDELRRVAKALGAGGLDGPLGGGWLEDPDAPDLTGDDVADLLDAAIEQHEMDDPDAATLGPRRQRDAEAIRRVLAGEPAYPEGMSSPGVPEGYEPDPDAPEKGEFVTVRAGDLPEGHPDRALRDPDEKVAVAWRQQHDILVREALHSWKGWPNEMRVHMAHDREGAPIPDSGGGKEMRAMAAALRWEINNRGKLNDRPLYRGSHAEPDAAVRAWSEKRSVADSWAWRHNFARERGQRLNLPEQTRQAEGRVFTAEPGTVKGLRVADYEVGGIDSSEQEWLSLPVGAMASPPKPVAFSHPGFRNLHPNTDSPAQVAAATQARHDLYADPNIDRVTTQLPKRGGAAVMVGWVHHLDGTKEPVTSLFITEDGKVLPGMASAGLMQSPGFKMPFHLFQHREERQRESMLENPPEPVTGIPDYEGKLTDRRSAGGTTGARIAVDEDGNGWLVKTYRGDQDRVATELLANAIYRELGVTVPNAGRTTVKVPKHGDTMAMAYPLIEGETRRWQGEDPTLGEGFVADALLANWDVVGLAQDNVLWNEEIPIRVDQGGTLEYRAQGQMKPFGPVPTELWTMTSPKGQAFGRMRITEPSMRAQAGDAAVRLTPGRIDELVDEAPFEDEEMRERVRENLKLRVAWLDRFSQGEEDLPEPLEREDAKAEFTERDTDWETYPEEDQALADYLDPEGREEIDTHLRSGAAKKKASEDTQRDVAALDGLLAAPETKTTDDVAAWLPVPNLDSLGVETAEKLEGKWLRERSYLNPDLDFEPTPGTTVIRLIIPEGSNAIWPSALDSGVLDPTPGRVILPRGTSIRLSGAREVNGAVVIDAVAVTR
jgi:hypothetical protein